MLGSDGKDSEEQCHNSEDEGSLLWGGSLAAPQALCAPLGTYASRGAPHTPPCQVGESQGSAPSHTNGTHLY